jgi:glycosyltransferase involved in cell wall biosynthesis
MCPGVEYLAVGYRGFTHTMKERIERKHKKREERERQRRQKYEEIIAKGGVHAALRRLDHVVREAPFEAAKTFLWKIFVVTPSAYLLKAQSESLRQERRTLLARGQVGIEKKYAWTLNLWAATHAFAVNADKVTAGRHFDVVQVWDNYALVAGARLAKRTGAKLVYDAVEIATDRVAQDLSILENVREHFERKEDASIFLKADKMIGTGDALAGWYEKRYKIPKPLVVRNCRHYWPYKEDGRLRADIGATPDTRILLWCGSAYPQQGIEVLMRTLPLLPSHIHVAVVTEIADCWRKYITQDLPEIAKSLGVEDRFHILSERGPLDLVPYISDGDLGFVLSVPVDHPNQYYNLPNKFFECIMGRMPIGTLAFPEVVGIVEKYKIGCVMDEHDSAKNAEIIQKMLDPEYYSILKANVMVAAQELSWEHESRPYVQMVDTLMPEKFRKKALALRGEPAAG